MESRLFKIIYYLLDKGTMTAPKLAEKLEVSVRTIYRDIDSLSSSGIPVYATQGKGGGITISDEFVLDKSFLSEKEKEQVLIALQGLIATDRKNDGELLCKLGSLFRVKNTNWIEVDFSNWSKGTDNKDTFNYLKNAILQKNIVELKYWSNKELSSREVAPLKLVFKSKDWYLYGFCMLRSDYRFFKLTRIKDIKIKEETYSDDIVIPSSVISETQMENTISVLLKFDKKMAFRVYDEFSDGITVCEDGNLYVRADLPDSDVLYSYILSFQNYVEVIEPIEIRNLMKEKILEISKKYRT